MTGELLHKALGETEELLAGLLADEAGADIQAAVDQVLLANGWPGRPHVIGSIQTRRTRTVHAPDGHRATLTEVVTRALIEAARRRRDRLQGKPNSGYDPLFNGAAPVQPGAREGGAEDTTLADLICDRLQYSVRSRAACPVNAASGRKWSTMQPPSCSGTGVSLPLILALRSALKLRMRSAMVFDRVKAVRPLDRSEAAVLDAEIRQLASNRTCERVASDAGRVLLHH